MVAANYFDSSTYIADIGVMDEDEDMADSMELLLSEMELPEPEAVPKPKTIENVEPEGPRQTSHIPSFVCLGSAATNASVEFHPLGHIQHRRECRRMIKSPAKLFPVSFEAEISWTKVI
jgi:hypothetical protein